MVTALWDAGSGTGSPGSLPQGSSGGCQCSCRAGLPVTGPSSGLGRVMVPAAVSPVPTGAWSWVPRRYQHGAASGPARLSWPRASCLGLPAVLEGCAQRLLLCFGVAW